MLRPIAPITYKASSNKHDALSPLPTPTHTQTHKRAHKHTLTQSHIIHCHIFVL